MMKWCSTSLAIVLLSVCLAACGSGQSAVPSSVAASRSTATSTSSNTEEASQNFAKVDQDEDNDAAPADDRNNNEILDYGQPASTADKRAVTALLKRFYAAAAAENGAAACSMLYLTLVESIVEDHGKGSAGPAYLKQATSCPEVLTLLFKHFHDQLTVETPLLKVTRVRLKRHSGLAVLSFGKLPKRKILIREQQGVWKLNALLDDELP